MCVRYICVCTVSPPDRTGISINSSQFLTKQILFLYSHKFSGIKLLFAPLYQVMPGQAAEHLQQVSFFITFATSELFITFAVMRSSLVGMRSSLVLDEI
jgi:hypothetical protein